MRTHNLYKGITLLEVLLSVAIISLMMGAVVIIYTGALRHWKWEDPKLLLQQEATIAMNKIERQLKKAGTVFVAGENSVEFLPLPEVAPSNDGYTEALYHMDDDWNDTANGHNGTAYGDSTFTNPDDGEYGVSGNGGKFGGDGDYVECAGTFGFDGKLTLEAWVQPHIGSSSQTIMYIDDACRLYLNDSEHLVGGIYYSGDWHDLTSGRTVPRNNSTWSHVSLTYDESAKTGEKLQLHINGHNVAAEYAQDVSPPGILYIGKELTPDISYFHGVIDEVRISDDIRRTKISWEGDPEEKIILEVSEISHQLNDESNTDTFVISYYDGDYNEVIDTSTQANRNSIRIVKVLLGLEKNDQKFSLENTIALRKEEPGEEASDDAVGYWKMDESSWNGTAGEVIDSSGNNNHGTAKNGANTVAGGKINRCGSFDGNNDYVDCGLMSFGTTLTFEAWIKLEAKTGGWRNNQGIISAYAGPYSGIPLILEADEEGNSLNFYDGDGVSATFNLVGEWHHVVATRDGENKTIYIDGIERASKSVGSGGTGTGVLKIGFTGDYGRYFKGMIDEVKIYNRALSKEEIKEKTGFIDSMKSDFDTGAYDETIWEGDYVGLAHP